MSQTKDELPWILALLRVERPCPVESQKAERKLDANPGADARAKLGKANIGGLFESVAGVVETDSSKTPIDREANLLVEDQHALASDGNTPDSLRNVAGRSYGVINPPSLTFLNRFSFESGDKPEKLALEAGSVLSVELSLSLFLFWASAFLHLMQ